MRANRKFFRRSGGILRTAMLVTALGGAPLAAVQAQEVSPKETTQEQTLPLGELLEQMLRDDSGYMAAQAKIDAEEEKISTAKADFFPSITANGRFGLQQQDNSNLDVPRDDLDEKFVDADISIKQLIWDFGRTSSEVRKSKRAVAVARLEMQKTEAQLIMDGLSAYFEYIGAAKRLRYAQSAEENIKRKSRMESTAVSYGAGYKASELRAKKELAEAMLERVSVEKDLEIATYRYRDVFGFAPGADLADSYEVINPAILPETVEEAVARAMEYNPEILQAELDLHQAEDNVSAASSELWPVLEAVGSYNYLQDYDGYLGDRTETLAYLNLKVPLFSGMKNWSNRTAAQRSVEEARYKLEKTRKQVAYRVNEIWRGIEARNAEMRYRKDRADVVSELLDHARRQQAGGALTALDVVDIETDFIKSIEDVVAAEADALLKIFELSGMMGDLRQENLTDLLTPRS